MPPKILAMILAGGRGERLHPLTQDRAKPAVPFGGIYRIIDFTLSNCLNSGIRRVNLLTQYKSLSLNRHIMQGWNIFNPELDEFINLIPAQQRVGEDWYLGTADAIYQNIYVLQMDRPDLVLILSGDHVYKMNYMEMIAYHLEKRADLTVAVIEMDKSLSPPVRRAAGGRGVSDRRVSGEAGGPQDHSGAPRSHSGQHGNLCVQHGNAGAPGDRRRQGPGLAA